MSYRFSGQRLLLSSVLLAFSSNWLGAISGRSVGTASHDTVVHPRNRSTSCVAQHLHGVSRKIHFRPQLFRCTAGGRKNISLLHDIFDLFHNILKAFSEINHDKIDLNALQWDVKTWSLPEASLMYAWHGSLISKYASHPLVMGCHGENSS